MRISIDVDNRHFEFERDPLPPERFAAVCKLVGAAIGGGVLLGAIAMAGFYAIPCAVVALVIICVYKGAKGMSI